MLWPVVAEPNTTLDNIQEELGQMTDLPRRKMRTTSHRMEDQSSEILRAVLPDDWVIRNYKPDYGIDFVIELFADASDDGKSATLGEHVFVQLKSVQSGNYDQIAVSPRHNIELPDFQPKPADESPEADAASHAGAMPEESLTLDVIKFLIDTALLNTVDAMGSAVPVLLVLVDLSGPKIFYICLNDYIEKVLWPTKPEFQQQDHTTVYIPCTNELRKDNDSLLALRWYGKRAKLYSALAKVLYQSHYMSSFNDDPDDPMRTLAASKHFFEILSRLDFWSAGELWRPLLDKQNDIEGAIKALETALQRYGLHGAQGSSILVKSHWESLASLSRFHEEVCREWYLPTHLSTLLRGK